MDVLRIFTHLRGEDGQWSGWEWDELSRLKAAAAVDLENQIWEDGVTDSGDPWIVAVDEDSHELSLHVARLSGAYVAVSGDLSPVASGANLKSVVNDCLAHIRSTRQETVFTDGATLRMPVGVSAAAFGIFLTERLAAFDERQDQGQASLEVSKLGPDQSESFVFLSRLAISPAQLQAEDVDTVLSERESALGEDQIIFSGFADEGIDQIATAMRTVPTAPTHEGEEAVEIDVAGAMVKAPVTAGTPALFDAAIASQTDTSQAHTETVDAETETGAGQAEVVDVVVGMGKIGALAPIQVADEDRSGDEDVSDQPEDGGKAVVASEGDAVVTTASSTVAQPVPGEGAADVDVFAEMTTSTEFLPLDHPLAMPSGDDVDHIDMVWEMSDPRDDVFAV